MYSGPFWPQAMSKPEQINRIAVVLRKYKNIYSLFLINF